MINKLDPDFSYISEVAIFYFKKQLNNASALSCHVLPMPLHEHHRISYSFVLALSHGDSVEHETVEDVTCDRDEAERIFDLICKNCVYPCHLFDVVSDLIA